MRNIPTIVLNTFEQRLCKALAKERQDTNDANHIHDGRIDPNRTGFEIHHCGAQGEIAVARYLNVYPDFTTQSRRGGSELMYKGYKVDVKNAHPHENLMTPRSKKLGEADIYVCVSGFNSIRLMGWCYEAELITPERAADWTPVRSYFVPKDELRDIASLLGIVEKAKWTEQH